MRVLFIGPLPEPTTGQSLACRVLLDGLTENHEVDVIDLSKKDFRQGISSSSRIAEIAGVLWRVFRKRGAADVIYLTVSESRAGNLKDLLVYCLCFRRLRDMVIHLHGGAGMRLILLGDRPGLRRLNTFFLRRLGAAIVLGNRHVDLYEGVVPNERIHIVPNFAEDRFFTTADAIDARFSKTRPLKLLFLSNLLPGKGHDELLEAFLGLDHRTRSAVELDFAGGFESSEQQRGFLARIAGLEGVRYHGTVAGEQKKALFHAAHLFCLPTYYPYEGQPISILEAYASGCAVITTGHSGIPDIFHDGTNGIQVPPRSASDLRGAIEKALREPEQLRRMAHTNLTTALANYRTRQYQRALVRIIDSIGQG
jgi:glycosyltransferase involved in cell wall biosynthesis